jgi:hypothetical protein
MDFRTIRPVFRGALLAIFACAMCAQIPSPKAVLDLSETEQVKFVTEAMNAGFPSETADHMTMLILNRGSLVIPILEAQILEELRSPSSKTDFVSIALEMIAYAGDENALRVVAKLAAIDESRFANLVGRTLDHALHFRNPYSVVYRGFDIGNAAVSRQLVLWSESSLSHARMRRLFGEAIRARYGKVPEDTEWENDPIASRIGIPQRQGLKQEVLRFAREAAAPKLER